MSLQHGAFVGIRIPRLGGKRALKMGLESEVRAKRSVLPRGTYSRFSDLSRASSQSGSQADPYAIHARSLAPR